MKVLLVTPEYPPDFAGGIVTYYRHLIPALRKAGCEISVLKGSAFVHGNEPYQHDGVNVAVLETSRYANWIERFSHFAMFPELRRHLAASFALHEQAAAGDDCDVVEVTDWGMLFIPWVIAAKSRVLVQLHGSVGQIWYQEPVAGREAEAMFSMLLEKTALREASALCSSSKSNARWWEQSLRRSVHYLPPALPVESVNVAANAGNKWLAVGRIQHWKGPQVACAAWNILGKAAPLLEWVGRDTRHGLSGQSTSFWLKKQFGGTWGKRILPVGQMFPDDVKDRMRAAKALLVPSTWDVFNLGTVEAMAMGKVVVVSSAAGAADLVHHGVNGFIFPNGDATALATLILDIQRQNIAALQEIGSAATSTIVDRLNPTRVGKDKAALYRDLPAPNAAGHSCLRELVLSASSRKPLGFLDGLPLKDLSRYVARRTARKLLSKPTNA